MRALDAVTPVDGRHCRSCSRTTVISIPSLRRLQELFGADIEIRSWSLSPASFASHSTGVSARLPRGATRLALAVFLARTVRFAQRRRCIAAPSVSRCSRNLAVLLPHHRWSRSALLAALQLRRRRNLWRDPKTLAPAIACPFATSLPILVSVVRRHRDTPRRPCRTASDYLWRRLGALLSVAGAACRARNAYNCSLTTLLSHRCVLTAAVRLRAVAFESKPSARCWAGSVSRFRPWPPTLSPPPTSSSASAFPDSACCCSWDLAGALRRLVVGLAIGVVSAVLVHQHRPLRRASRARPTASARPGGR